MWTILGIALAVIAVIALIWRTMAVRVVRMGQMESAITEIGEKARSSPIRLLSHDGEQVECSTLAGGFHRQDIVLHMALQDVIGKMTADKIRKGGRRLLLRLNERVHWFVWFTDCRPFIIDRVTVVHELGMPGLEVERVS